MNAPANISYEDRLKAAAKARRARLGFGRAVKPADEEKRPAPEEAIKKEQATPTAQNEIRFDEHVVAFRLWRFGLAQPVHTYIRQRSEELGVSYEAVVGPSRLRKFVEVRHRIIWEIKTKVKPSISYPELGRIFGGRDHSSIIFAIKKMDENQAKTNE